MITFAIPTYNRAKHLKKCLDSICSQISGRKGFYITVCDNKSTDNTFEILTDYSKRFSFLSFKTLPRHVAIQDCQGSWAGSVEMAQTEWTWTFGDDDFLIDKSLDIVLSAIERNVELNFIHAAQKGRCSKTHKIYKFKSLLSLCEKFGWIDTCGFISSNIIKTKELKLAYENYDNKEYNKGVFAQPSMILQQLASAPAAILDYPIVDLQDQIMTDETKKRWFVENHGTRYFYTCDAIKEVMRRQPYLPQQLSPTFFRYHTYHLWERHMHDILEHYLSSKNAIPPQLFDQVTGYASIVSDPNTKKNILGSVLNLQDAISMMESTKAQMEANETRLNVIKSINDSPVFGWQNIAVDSHNAVGE